MQRNNFLLLATFPIAAVVFAVFYLSDSPVNDDPVDIGNASNQRAKHLPTPRSIDLDRSHATSSSFTDQVKKLNPADFSSNPAQQTWEKEIFKLVNNLDVSDGQKVQQLLGMMHRLPNDGKVLALEQAAILIPDEDYVRLRPTILSHASTTELRETILHDVLTRSDAIRMPALVEFLRHPSYITKSEIAEILSAYLDQDFGTDANQWDVAVKKWIIENPEI